MVRLSLAQNFLDAAKTSGADVRCLLAPLGLTPEAFVNPEFLVPAPIMYDVVEVLGDATGDRFIGVHLGESLNPLSWPPLIEAASMGRTIGDLLLRFSLDANKHATSVNYTLETHGIRCTFAEQRMTDGGRRPRHNDAFGMAFVIAILKTATGGRWQGSEVLVHTCDPSVIPPGYLGLRSAEGDTMGFRISFPCEWLLLEPSLPHHPDDAGKASPDNMPPNSLSALRHILLDHLDNPGLDANQVASLCGMSKRTLARRLAEHNTTLKAETDRLRMARAKMALLNENPTIAEVGASVGYPEPSVFTRVFRRWTGMSPRQYREQGKKHAG